MVKFSFGCEVLHPLKSKGGPKPGSLLKRKIAIRLTEWDISKTGYVEMNLVVHCGSSTFGDYINTLSTTEVSSGWWEGEAIMGKSQQSTFQALKQIRTMIMTQFLVGHNRNGETCCCQAKIAPYLFIAY